MPRYARFGVAVMIAGYIGVEFVVSCISTGLPTGPRDMPTSVEHDASCGKCAEAVRNLEILYQSSVAYYETRHLDSAGRPLPPQFPATQAPTPVIGSCCGQRDDACDPALTFAAWSTFTWMALQFSISYPFYYSYGYSS